MSQTKTETDEEVEIEDLFVAKSKKNKRNISVVTNDNSKKQKTSSSKNTKDDEDDEEVEEEHRVKWTVDMEEYLLRSYGKVIKKHSSLSVKSNHWQEIQTQMLIRYRNANLTVTICRNKFNKLKKDYSVYKQMINSSGFAADGTPHDELVWKNYVQHHPEAKKFKNQPFIHYDTMASILGDNVFTGKKFKLFKLKFIANDFF